MPQPLPKLTPAATLMQLLTLLQQQLAAAALAVRQRQPPDGGSSGGGERQPSQRLATACALEALELAAAVPVPEDDSEDDMLNPVMSKDPFMVKVPDVLEELGSVSAPFVAKKFRTSLRILMSP